MNNHHDSTAAMFSQDKFEENSALVSDLENQIRISMESETAETIINTFHTLRYTLDLELVVALRNSAGYLQAAGVIEEERINEVLINAIKDTLSAFQRSNKSNLVEIITERAKKTKDMLSVAYPVENQTH